MLEGTKYTNKSIKRVIKYITALDNGDYKVLYFSVASMSLACVPGSVWEWPESATTWNSASGHLYHDKRENQHY